MEEERQNPAPPLNNILNLLNTQNSYDSQNELVINEKNYIMAIFAFKQKKYSIAKKIFQRLASSPDDIAQFANYELILSSLTHIFITEKNPEQAKYYCDKMKDEEEKLVFQIRINKLTNDTNSLIKNIKILIRKYNNKKNILHCMEMFDDNDPNKINMLGFLRDENVKVDGEILYRYGIVASLQKKNTVALELFKNCISLGYEPNLSIYNYLIVKINSYSSTETERTEQNKTDIINGLNKLCNTLKHNDGFIVFGDFYNALGMYENAYEKYNAYITNTINTTNTTLTKNSYSIVCKIINTLTKILKDGTDKEIVDKYMSIYYKYNMWIITESFNEIIYFDFINFIIKINKIQHLYPLLLVGLNKIPQNQYIIYLSNKYFTTNLDDKKRMLLKLINDNYNNLNIYLDLHEIYAKENNNDMLMKILVKGVSNNFIECNIMLGEYLFREKNYKKAYNVYKNIANKNIHHANLARSINYITIIYKSLKKHDELIIHNRECFDKTQDYSYIYNIAQIYYELNDFQPIFTITKSYNLFQNYPDIYLLYTKIYLKMNIDNFIAANSDVDCKTQLETYTNLAIINCIKKHGELYYTLGYQNDKIISLKYLLKSAENRYLKSYIALCVYYMEGNRTKHFKKYYNLVYNYEETLYNPDNSINLAYYAIIEDKINCYLKIYNYVKQINIRNNYIIYYYIKNYKHYSRPEILARLIYIEYLNSIVGIQPANYLELYNIYEYIVMNANNGVNMEDEANILMCCNRFNKFDIYNHLIRSKIAVFIITSKKKYKRQHLPTELLNLILNDFFEVS